MLQTGQLGVHPPGALGVAFFVHTRAECFVGRGGDGITDPLKRAGVLQLDDGGTPRSVPLRERIFSNLLEADALQRLPELLFVCCNPDQLGAFTGELTRTLENLAERDKLKRVDDVRRRVPILLILPNGILSEHTSQTYEEQLRESSLMGRLPGVGDDVIRALLDRLVRGISLQAGGRRGAGPDTVYVLERKGTLLFAGGGEIERRRIEAILTQHDYPFKHVVGVPGTRIEFDKAMISIVLNVGGLIHTVKPDGELIDVRMGDLCKDPSKQDFIQRVTRAVFDVGVAAGAYPADAGFDEIWAGHRATIMAHAGHVTSSLKAFRDALGRGLNSVKLFSNEEWILTPLIRYAAKAGFVESEQLFRALGHQVQEAMARAIHFRDARTREPGGRTRAMRLAAQRNFTIELFDAGEDNMLLVGSMLDDEHLIKLEINVFLPDEQITRSKLDMIRVPFPVCREVERLAESLVGLRIERGVLGGIAKRVGGHVGCSHIKELATNIIYFAASHLVRRSSGVDPMSTDYALKPVNERFSLTKELLRDSCLAYCQTTPQGLDEQIGIRRIGDEHAHPLPLGDYEPSLGVLLRDRMRQHSGKTFLRYRSGDEESSISWEEFGETALRIAGHLIDQGIRPGDRICLLSENRAEMFLFELAVMSIGAVSVPIFAGYGPRQIAYVLGHARPRYLVASGRHQLDKIEPTRHPWIERCYSMDFDPACEEWGARDFAALTTESNASRDRVNERIDAVRPDDLCVVMYTSGTTGPPKGVQLCHRNLISQQKAIALIWDVRGDDVLMAYLPWHHSFGGLFERFLTLYSGCQLCLDDSRGRDTDRLVANWRAFDPTMFFSVPRVHEMLMHRCLEDPAAEKMVVDGRLRFGFTAGAPLPAKVAAFYREHHIPILEGWGLTETSPCVTLMTPDDAWRSGYVGFPIPGVKIRIDSDQEILVKGPNVMLGYLDDEEATSHVIDPDGWFRTGDLGEFTGDGLRIFGRKDGAFKLTTGEKVHPQRIENVLINESPYIGLALAVGSGKDYVGALIYPDEPQARLWAEEHGVAADQVCEHPDFRALIAAEVQRLNPLIEVKYQRVRRVVLIDGAPSLDRGEITPSGKIVRSKVVRAHQKSVDALFAAVASSEVIEVPQAELERTVAGAQ